MSGNGTGGHSEENDSLFERGQLSRRDALKRVGAGAAITSLAGCVGGVGPGSGDNTFKIGGVWALSQGWGTYGRMQEQHARLAVNQINDEGGIDGRDVELILEDSEIDPGVTTEKTRRLIQQDDVDVLLGPNASSSRAAMSELATQHEIPLLYPLYYEGTEAPDYCNKWLFKFGGVPYGSVKPLVPYAMENFGESFFLIGMDYVWPRATNTQIKKFVGENGGEIVGETYVPIGTTDYSSIIPRIEENDPDVVWGVLGGPEAMGLQQQMHERGLRENWQEIHMGMGPLTFQDVDPGPVNGILEPHAYYPSIESEENSRLIESMQDEYGDDAILSTNGGPFYTAVRALPTAVENGGGTENEQIRDGYRQLNDFSSPMGPISFPHDQQAELTYYLGQIQIEENQPYWQAHNIIEQFGPLSPPDTCDDI